MAPVDLREIFARGSELVYYPAFGIGDVHIARGLVYRDIGHSAEGSRRSARQPQRWLRFTQGVEHANSLGSKFSHVNIAGFFVHGYTKRETQFIDLGKKFT